jgi:hypothetical protein
MSEKNSTEPKLALDVNELTKSAKKGETSW